MPERAQYRKHHGSRGSPESYHWASLRTLLACSASGLSETNYEQEALYLGKLVPNPILPACRSLLNLLLSMSYRSPPERGAVPFGRGVAPRTLGFYGLSPASNCSN